MNDDPVPLVAALLDADALGEGGRAVVVDLDRLDAEVEALRAAFPASWRHTAAIKANPLVPVLRRLVARGLGLEAAGIEEAHLGRAAGAGGSRLVFDSPAKTPAEIATALGWRCVLNADNLDELDRIDVALAAGAPRGPLGLRINPEVGEGTIGITSVGGRTSRFGVPLSERRRILDAFRARPWLVGLHVHAGSQGMSLEQLAEAVGRVVELAHDIEAVVRRLAFVDVGGGLPVAYRPGDPEPSYAAWAEALRERSPELFLSRWTVLTELGRRLHAHTAVAVSRVEYVRRQAGRRMATIHLGADLLLRRAYAPHQWFHRLTVLDAHGRPKTGPVEPWDVLGPLCFAGDVIARDEPLPSIEPGDLLVVHDVGAYTLGMWSRHGSRGMPAVWGAERDGIGVRLSCLRPAETAADVVRFWAG